MDAALVLHLGKRALETALLISAPILIVTVAVGFFTAMLQAVTSIRDMTMGMVVKLAAVGLTLLFCGGWMMNVAVDFTAEIFNYMQSLGH